MIPKTHSPYASLVLSTYLLTAGFATAAPTIPQAAYPMTVAVAPPLNHSGIRDLDVIRVGDLMISELTHFGGVRALPLNRVLAQLETDGKDTVDSPAYALDIMRRVGADAILVLAVNEYNPYPPPVLGLSAQLFGYGPHGAPSVNPVQISRHAAPLAFASYSTMPRADFQRVFDASDEILRSEMEHFAQQRNAEDSPYGWRKFIVAQDQYLRFCCHLTVRELIRQELTHVPALGVRQSEVERP